MSDYREKTARPSTGNVGTPALAFRSDPVGDTSGANLNLSALQTDSGGALRVVSETGKNTFDYAISFTPATSASTDIAILNGSATATVKVTQVGVQIGYATGAAADQDISLTIRSTANTTGTHTAVTGVSRDAAATTPATATATFVYYTAPPSALGTSLGIIRTKKFNQFSASATTNGIDSVIWNFNNNNEQPLILRGVANGLAITNGGTAFDTLPLVVISLTTTEEALTA